MKVKFLGTATSTGVPVPSCSCAVCQSTDLRDKRLRSSLYIEHEGTHLLIDTGPDLRTQLLRENINQVDALLYTHAHFDHIAGIDDIKVYTRKTPLPIYTSQETFNSLYRSHFYHFNHEQPTSHSATAHLIAKPVKEYEEFSFKNALIKAIPIEHAQIRPFGYRIDSLAYLLDCKNIPPTSLKHLQGLDVLIISGLKPHISHPNHLTFEEAAEYAVSLKPKLTLLTHISDAITHAKGNEYLSQLSPLCIQLAYDGLEIEITKDKQIYQRNSSWLEAKLK